MSELMKRYKAEHKGIMPCGMEIPGGFIYSKEYVAWLESQLRWRPVSEKPKESDRYLVKYRQGKIVKKFIADYDVVLGWNMPLPDVEIIEWLPIPTAPEEKNE